MLPTFAGPAVFALHPRLEADTLPVGDLALASVLLLNDARFPWFVLVPRRPEEDECCGTGCVPCVFDVYEEALERYRAALAAWKARHPDADA